MRLLVLFLFTFSLFGCKETQCPAFPTSLTKYFPYAIDDELRFINANDDTLKLNITKDWTSENYSVDWNCKCSCEADAGFDTDDSDKYSIRIEGRIHFYNENNTSILSCNFYDAQLSNDNFEIEKVIIDPYSNQLLESFGDTLFIEKDDFYRIGNVKIIKSKGIVEFWDKKQNCVWSLIE
jgi:hypothetical protein